jgi:hypothetical protein
MDNAVGDGNVSATEIGPSLFLESRQQFKPDLAISYIVLVDVADHRCERLDRVGAADHADEFAVLDDRESADVVFCEKRDGLGDIRIGAKPSRRRAP